MAYVIPDRRRFLCMQATGTGEPMEESKEDLSGTTGTKNIGI